MQIEVSSQFYPNAWTDLAFFCYFPFPARISFIKHLSILPYADMYVRYPA